MYLIVTFSVVLCAISFWIRWRKNKMTLFERYGIPGPKPSFITGNLNEFHEKREKCIDEWTKKYGKIFGLFLGGKLFIICSDVELIKLMQIKEFKNFSNKDLLLPDGGLPHKIIYSFLELQRDEKWKNMRSTLSSSFSTGKIKMMSTLMTDPIKIFLKNIEEQKEEYFDIVEFYKKLTFDIICKSAFGITTKVQQKETNKFIQSVYHINDSDSSETLSSLSICFPEFEPIPTYLRHLCEASRNLRNLPCVEVVVDTCMQMIDSRKKSQYHSLDLLQSLLDSEDNTKEEKGKLSTEEVISNVFTFMAAGYETTSNTLSWCTYFLARHPEIQEKVRQEINNNIINNKDIDYEDLINLKYMEQVISETLRLFPLNAISINRVCQEDFKWKEVTIPKGAIVMIPVPNLHKDPSYWHEPEKFDPDRFSSGNKANINPFIYQPFGAGPRICLGMRLANIMLKLALSNLIRSFKLQPYKEEEVKIEHTLFIIRPMNGIKIKAIPL